MIIFEYINNSMLKLYINYYIIIGLRKELIPPHKILFYLKCLSK